MSVTTYEDKIKKCLEEAGRYSPALALNVYMLASAFETHSMLMKHFTGIASPVVEVKTRMGMIVRDHPIIGQLRDAENSILKQLKELGLTAEGTKGRTQGDAVVELLADIRGTDKKRKRAPLKPDKE